jgi:hypothetical protein
MQNVCKRCGDPHTARFKLRADGFFNGNGGVAP